MKQRKLSSFVELCDEKRRIRYEAYLYAHRVGFDKPCEICWQNPQAYAAVGHVCIAADRRNHSASDTPASGPVVEFRAVQAQPMSDEALQKHLNRKVHIYHGYKWR